MKSFTICALLAAGVSAIPMAAPHMGHKHHKRDVVWVTETAVDVVTVPITQTVWVDGSESTGEAKAHSYGGHGHETSTLISTTSVQPVAYSSSSSSSESSAPAVPSTTSTTSSYVAPTSVYVPPTTSSTTTTSAYVAPTTTTSAYVAPTTTTSAYVAPTTTTSEYTPPAYTPTSTYEAPTTTSAAAPTSTGGSGGANYVGALSYYAVGLGSCGNTNTDDEMVVAMDADMMDKASMCGKEIKISANGVTQTATVVDTCPGCRGSAGLDLSPSLFAMFAPTASGIVPAATWSFT